MKDKFSSAVADTKLLFRSIPPVVTALFTLSVVMMNILANKTVFQNDIIAIDGGIFVSWLSFLCMDIVTKAFGPRASTKLSVFAMLTNLFACLVFYLVSIIPTKDDFSAFNTVIGGTWFILLSSTVAFISSAVINNFLNWGIGLLFFKKQNEKLEFVTRSYISTFIAQFFDNLIFALLAFTVFAPIYWNGFHWTLIQCVTCSLLGAGLELLMEIVFSPIGYCVLKGWEKDGVGNEYNKRRAKS
ncbi:MAG: VUT family protein [Ruminococcaceae bacterium]|nr:VUT family protein [Oscillospiraceae bacterium]